MDDFNYDFDSALDFDNIDELEDEYIPSPIRNLSYRRHKQRLKTMKRYSIINHSGYAPHLGYIEHDFVDGKWQPVGDHIKYPKNSNRQRWMKKYTSKRIRNTDIPNGNKYRRVFDYWYKLY